MFLGRFAHNLDSKARLAVPARFRASLDDGVVVTRGMDRCIAAYPMEAWNELAGKIAALPTTDAHARRFRRLVFAEAANLVLDRQGRMVLPPELREFAGIDREVVVVGVHTSFEIWSPSGWEAMQAQVDDDGDALASHFSTVL